ncbi:DUF1643 domain-containing protein [Pseudomonas sp. GOM6]|uniref:DUF1643 domain-containing protein n=1 Tax=Pseudomonas sp. GOM6 TaxID=3036944 RepID=UPI00240A77F8|nr:DUF1643 domain-containing protein [Pseudomonas sp. GOM6]MDG1580964.1 DUF1643 domain-containing protein [Pseudomonas sp. GOM6]
MERECTRPFEDSKVIAYFGINPSTADAVEDDQTVRKWRGSASNRHAARLLMPGSRGQCTLVLVPEGGPCIGLQGNWSQRAIRLQHRRLCCLLGLATKKHH